ncbi:aspartyl protease family protein [Olivibacter sp. SDN3]|uniref:pepsin/retropepsin-like aspartic protease family protein n=1 Tax=Olivibacter sp. SDN3 TaxID=2764720 RepID=UPI00165188B6|nr:pepsin/retropepsin-like aspartic protease family protein [Olivibacter sp. SDN3]QNL47854.1 aspartyl protease family protein [Olivibacter sp. SDN3]
MRKLCLLFIAFLFVARNDGLKKKSDANSFKFLDSLASDLDYFKLQKEFQHYKNQLSKSDSLYFKAILASSFNDPEKSNEAIEAFFKIQRENTKDSLTKKMLATQLTNHINQFQYAKAVKINEVLQLEYAELLDSNKMGDLKNTHKIWQALEEVPPQKVNISANGALPLSKDKARLSTLAINTGNTTTDFVFDTGANFSVIQRSVAKDLGMKLLPAQFDVDAATGLKVKSDLAIADTLKLGEIIFNNVVFLVFDDKDLSFPTIDYEIKGIIGFPVIKALNEIHLTQDSLYIPQSPIEYSFNNLAYDEFMPIVKTNYNGDELRFNFDTGAASTSLYSRFYNKYQSDIDTNHTKINFNAGGAGGHTSFEGYLLDNIKLSVGNSEVGLKEIQLHPHRIGNTDELHGNLGQDFIQQFDTMIISFKYASILFR